MQLMVLFIGVVMYLFFTLNGGPLLFNPSDREAAAELPAVQAMGRGCSTTRLGCRLVAQVDVAERVYSRTGFGNPGTVAEAGFAAVAGAGGNLG